MHYIPPTCNTWTPQIRIETTPKKVIHMWGEASWYIKFDLIRHASVILKVQVYIRSACAKYYYFALNKIDLF